MALPRHFQIVTAQAVVALGFAAAFCPSNVWAQPVSATDSQVKILRAELKEAESRHADDARIGHLWRVLGIAYESRLAEDAAEDAYDRAIPLLRSSGRDSEYADTLHGLGSVYLNMQRRPEARRYMLEALAIYEKQNDQVKAAFLHQTVGISWMFDGKFKDAIAEFAASVADANASPNGEPEPLLSSYLLRAGAEYHTGDTAHGLEDIAAARKAAAQFELATNSVEKIAMSLTEGAALTRAGKPTEGDALIKEALDLLSTRNDFSPEVQQKMRIAVLREYGSALAAAHRKREAKTVEAQVAALQSQLPHNCADCSISVAALQGTLNPKGLR
jgi:tetratricopeptide (TPR) repeat protein